MLDSISKLLSSEFEIVGSVADGYFVLEAVERLHPNLLVMDIAMPRLDGIRTARELQSLHSDVKIVFLTVQDDEEYISAAFAAGARGYVFKSRMRTDLITALTEVLAGNLFVSQRSNHQK